MIPFTQKRICLALFLMTASAAFSQELPIYFEKEDIKFTGGTNELSLTGFSEATGKVVDNPNKSGINKSPKVGEIIRNLGPGQSTWAGSRLPLDNPFDFSSYDVISFKVYTAAPVGTEILLKLEDVDYANNGHFVQKSVYTTTSNEWELLYFTYPQSATSFDHLVFMFDFGNLGDGSEFSTFYFDNILQTSWDIIELGLDENNSESFQLFPNPTHSEWNINSESTITSVAIYDLQGKLIHHIHPNQNSVVINSGNMAKGMYLSEITTTTGMKTQKLIKQ